MMKVKRFALKDEKKVEEKKPEQSLEEAFKERFFNKRYLVSFLISILISVIISDILIEFFYDIAYWLVTGEWVITLPRFLILFMTLTMIFLVLISPIIISKVYKAMKWIYDWLT